MQLLWRLCWSVHKCTLASQAGTRREAANETGCYKEMACKVIAFFLSEYKILTNELIWVFTFSSAFCHSDPPFTAKPRASSWWHFTTCKPMPFAGGQRASGMASTAVSHQQGFIGDRSCCTQSQVICGPRAWGPNRGSSKKGPGVKVVLSKITCA